MVDAHEALVPRHANSASVRPLQAVRVPDPAPRADLASGPTYSMHSERQSEMLLLHEALARAQCSDRCSDWGSERLMAAEANRHRQRHLRAARAHRRLEIALRKLERAAREAERSDAVAAR
jgi:hypothetical protein